MKVQKIKARYRYSVILLKQIVKTDFKLRYQGSVLGYLWSLLRPLLLFLILYLVFTVFLPIGKGVPHYPVYLLTGIVIWNYFAEVTAGSVTAIVGKGDLLRKINFPKYVMVLAVSFSALINLLFNIIVVAVFMVINQVVPSVNAWLIIPLLIELFVAGLAMSFLLSALYVHFRDISYIWEVVLQAAFYATPILYALQRVPHHYAKFLILNPIAQIIQDVRHVLITPYSQTINQVYGGDKWIWLIPIGVTLVVLVASAAYFRSHSKSFAENV